MAERSIVGAVGRKRASPTKCLLVDGNFFIQVMTPESLVLNCHTTAFLWAHLFKLDIAGPGRVFGPYLIATRPSPERLFRSESAQNEYVWF